MQALNVEYEGESVSVALYEGIEVDELLEVMSSSLRVTGTIIGLKGPNGVVLLPKFICQHVGTLELGPYELLVRPKDARIGLAVLRSPETSKSAASFAEPDSKRLTSAFTTSIKSAAKSSPEMSHDQELVSILTYLKLDQYLGEQEERSLWDLWHAGNGELMGALQAYRQYVRLETS